MQQLPDPLEFGYAIDSESGLLVPQLMSQSITPLSFSVILFVTALTCVKKTAYGFQMGNHAHRPVNVRQWCRRCMHEHIHGTSMC